MSSTIFGIRVAVDPGQNPFQLLSPAPTKGSVKVTAPLDPAFRPAIIFNRCYTESVRASGKGVPLVLGLEREKGLLSQLKTWVRNEADDETLRYIERLVKFLLWARGGWKLHFGGPKRVGEFIRRTYSSRGARNFDCKMMSLAY